MPNDKRMPGIITKKILYGLFFIAAILLLAAGTLFLWNEFLPRLIHVPAINYWQALGLLILSRILFGSFRFGGFGWQRSKASFLNEEDRAAFKEEWRKRCEQHGMKD